MKVLPLGRSLFSPPTHAALSSRASAPVAIIDLVDSFDNRVQVGV
jgi:hypothetical protein